MTVVIALKSPQEMSHVLALPRHISGTILQKAWDMTDYREKLPIHCLLHRKLDVLLYLRNAMASYAIARNRKKSRFFNFLYYYFISAMFIPFNVLMLPLVNEANKFHIDNAWNYVFVYCIWDADEYFLYTGYIKSIPEALMKQRSSTVPHRFRRLCGLCFPS